jgi:hypothetical protein
MVHECCCHIEFFNKLMKYDQKICFHSGYTFTNDLSFLPNFHDIQSIVINDKDDTSFQF